MKKTKKNISSILHARKNGLEVALRRVGKKILIRKDLFINWIEDKQIKKFK